MIDHQKDGPFISRSQRDGVHMIGIALFPSLASLALGGWVGKRSLATEIAF